MALFVELQSEQEREEAFQVLQGLDSTIERSTFMASFKHPWSGNRKLFGIRYQDELVSVAEVWFLITGRNESILWIHACITKEAHRSKGYGAILIKALRTLAMEMDCQEIRVHAHRDEAQNYWKQKQGFMEFSTIFRSSIP